MLRLNAVPLIAAMALVGAFPSATASPAQADEQLIAYERWVGDGSPDKEIWLMSSGGTGQRKLVDGCCFAWAPDGRSIAFNTESGSLATINVDGSGLRRLAGAVGGVPSWSPDGKRVAYAGREGLFVIGAAGGAPTRITHGDDSVPDWSPNGRKIVFERYLFQANANGGAIFVVDADGSGERQLADIGTYNPVWSPGGKRIAYWGWESEFEQGTYVMNPDGSEQALIGRTGTPNGGSGHDWSPGGGRIAFINRGAIHTVSADGRRHKRIARGRNDGPRWSPDGRSIAFRRTLRNRYDIYLMTSSGKNVTNLTDTPRPVLEDLPAWSPTRG